MAIGTVKFYDKEAGFGVIEYEDSEFVFHGESIMDGTIIKGGENVLFELEELNAEISAINIRLKK